MLSEASLSRVKKHFDDKDTTIVIFTAFRDGIKYEDNIRKNKEFAATLKNSKFGYFYVNGYFPENEGTAEEVNVKEDSIFAMAIGTRGDELIKLTHNLANSADQDSIIVKEASGDIYFLNQNGSKDKLDGQLKPGKIGKYYTQLRNKKKTNTFVFEAITDGLGFIKSFKNYFTNS